MQTVSRLHGVAGRDLEDGELFCWGQGGSGQLGVDPDSASGACGGTLCISPAHVPASDSVRFTRVDGGAGQTCG